VAEIGAKRTFYQNQLSRGLLGWLEQVPIEGNAEILTAYFKLQKISVNTLGETWGLICGSKTKVPESRLLFVFLCFAFILRLPFLVWTEPVHHDSLVYIIAAKDILRGEWSTTIVPPLYPLLLNIANMVTGDHAQSGVIISLVFGTLVVVPVFYLGREMYGVRAGAIAGLFAIAQPCMLRYSGSVLTESIYYFLVALIGLFAVKAYFTYRFRWVVLFGIVTAAGYLARERNCVSEIFRPVYAARSGPVVETVRLPKRPTDEQIHHRVVLLRNAIGTTT
jgi:hypothetical protein